MDVMPDVGTAHSIAAGAEFDGVHSNKTTRVGLAFFAEQDKWAVVLCSDNYFNPRTWMYEIFLRRTRVWYRRDHTTMVEDEQGYRGLLHVGDINLDLSVVHGRMQSIHSGEGRAFPNPTLLPWGTRPWVIRVLLIFQQEYEIQLPKCSATELVGHIERRITSLSQNIIPLIE